MGVAAPSRPVTPPLPIHQQSRSRQIDYHCLCEARLEVETWFTGERYDWRPFDVRHHIAPYCYRSGVPVQPLQLVRRP
jgi:hypothetical protein